MVTTYLTEINGFQKNSHDNVSDNLSKSPIITSFAFNSKSRKKVEDNTHQTHKNSKSHDFYNKFKMNTRKKKEISELNEKMEINEKNLKQYKKLIRNINNKNISLNNNYNDYISEISKKKSKISFLDNLIRSEIIVETRLSNEEYVNKYESEIKDIQDKIGQSNLNLQEIQELYDKQYKENYILKKNIDNLLKCWPRSEIQHKKYNVIQSESIISTNLKKITLRTTKKHLDTLMNSCSEKIAYKEKQINEFNNRILEIKLSLKEQEEKNNEFLRKKNFIIDQINEVAERNKNINFELKSIIRKYSMKLSVSIQKMYYKTKTKNLEEIIQKYKSQRMQREGNIIQKNQINKEISKHSNLIEHLKNELKMIQEHIREKNLLLDSDIQKNGENEMHTMKEYDPILQQLKKNNSLNEFFIDKIKSKEETIFRFYNLIEIYYEKVNIEFEKIYGNKNSKKMKKSRNLKPKSPTKLMDSTIIDDFQLVLYHDNKKKNLESPNLKLNNNMNKFELLMRFDCHNFYSVLESVQYFSYKITKIYSHLIFTIFLELLKTNSHPLILRKKILSIDDLNAEELQGFIKVHLVKLRDEFERCNNFIKQTKKEFLNEIKDTNNEINHLARSNRNSIKIIETKVKIEEKDLSEDSYISQKQDKETKINGNSPFVIDPEKDTLIYYKRMNDINKLKVYLKKENLINTKKNRNFSEVYFRINQQIKQEKSFSFKFRNLPKMLPSESSNSIKRNSKFAIIEFKENEIKNNKKRSQNEFSNLTNLKTSIIETKGDDYVKKRKKSFIVSFKDMKPNEGEISFFPQNNRFSSAITSDIPNSTDQYNKSRNQRFKISKHKTSNL